MVIGLQQLEGDIIGSKNPVRSRPLLRLLFSATEIEGILVGIQQYVTQRCGIPQGNIPSCLNSGRHVSSSSYVCYEVRPLVDPFRSHVCRSLFKRSATIPSANWGIVFHYTGQSVTRHSVYLEPVLFLILLQCVNLFCNLRKCILLFLSYISSQLPYNKTGRASEFYSFILVFLRIFCGLNTLFIIPVIFKQLCTCCQCPFHFS